MEVFSFIYISHNTSLGLSEKEKASHEGGVLTQSISFLKYIVVSSSFTFQVSHLKLQPEWIALKNEFACPHMLLM